MSRIATETPRTPPVADERSRDQRPRAGEQHRHLERLGEIVSGASSDQGDSLIDLAEGGHEEKRRRERARGLAKNIFARDVRKPNVTDDEIVRGAMQAGERFLAGPPPFDPIAFELEALAQRLAHDRIVFDQRDGRRLKRHDASPRSHRLGS
jgi:hypothetical protein